jgi:uncharacterized membrane protein
VGYKQIDNQIGEWEDAVFFIALILIAAVGAIVYFGSKQNESFRAKNNESPLEIIEKMYARGEIDRAEFARRRSVLKEGQGAPRKEDT